MGTDVSDFSKQYKVKADEGSVSSPICMPEAVTITFENVRTDPRANPRDITARFVPVGYDTRYGTNPHQALGVYKPEGRTTHIGDMMVHKIGKGGFSLTNLQDIAQATGMMKYSTDPSCVIMKHIGPCGFAQVPGATSLELYEYALETDPRSAFGGTVAFNQTVDEETAEKIMKLFTENVVARSYTSEALEVLRRNEGTKRLNNGIRVVEIGNMSDLPKFWGDDVLYHLSVGTLPTGELAIETPYLTGVRSVEDLIIDPEVDGVCVERGPLPEEMRDAVTGWYGIMHIRSNAVDIVKDRKSVGIGMGQQDRVGAVELAIRKADKYGMDLEGAVLVSEAFFPNRDSIDEAAKAGISAILWPAGSRKDKEIIAAGNEHGMAMMVTPRGERCFTHN